MDKYKDFAYKLDDLGVNDQSMVTVYSFASLCKSLGVFKHQQEHSQAVKAVLGIPEVDLPMGLNIQNSLLRQIESSTPGLIGAIDLV